MSAKMVGASEDGVTEVVESPEFVQINMPKQLFDMLEWEEGDGVEWFFVDKERCLLKRVPKDLPLSDTEVVE
jgi:hypothetical protein